MIVLRIIQGSTIGWAVVNNTDQVEDQLIEFWPLLKRLSAECEDYSFFGSAEITGIDEYLLDKLIKELRVYFSGDNGNWEITLEQVDSITSMDI